MKILILSLIALSHILLSASASVKVITDTNAMEGDGSRIFVSMKLAQIEDVGLQVVQNNINAKKSHIMLFIPASLSESEREKFINIVSEQMSLSKTEAEAIELLPIDIHKLNEVAEETKQQLDELDLEPSHRQALRDRLNQMVGFLQSWKTSFITKLAKIKNWKAWPTEQRLMLVGSAIGIAKSALSIGFWIPTTGANVYGYSQAGMSLFLDFFFARWGHRVEAWKGRHHIEAPNWLKKKNLFKKVTSLYSDNRTYNKVINFYNKTPVLKAFLIDNLIAVSAGLYFRSMSWAADTTGRVESPLSMDFATNVLGGMSIGGISGAAGGQGVRTLRRKGYIGPRTEYGLYQLFGLGMQIGGFLNGAGMSSLFWVFLKAEAFFKLGIYTASRALPNRNPRTLIFHQGLSEPEVKNIQYQHGMYDAIAITPDNYKEEINKHTNSESYFTKIRKKWKFIDKLAVGIKYKTRKIRCRLSLERK